MESKNKHEAIQIANYIISQLKVNNLHLQKLLYYLQINYMVDNDGSLLFNDRMEKWKLGPVVPSVYHIFKDYGPSLIDSPHKDFNIKQDEDNGSFKIEFIDIQLKDEDVKKYIDSCLEDLSKYNRFDLVEKTHEHKPWKDDEPQINQGIKNITYNYEELMQYFSKNEDLLLVERG